MGNEVFGLFRRNRRIQDGIRTSRPLDKNGHEFEFTEKETGFVEEATAVFDNSAELLIIGFNSEGENKVMVASNMSREVAL